MTGTPEKIRQRGVAKFHRKGDLFPMEYSVERQISFALENEPGVLARVCAVLRERSINIHALSIVDNVEQGMVRLVTSDPAAAVEAIRALGLYPIQADVIDLRPASIIGKLGEISRALADAGVNIDYAYGSEMGSGSRMSLILRVSPMDAAQTVLNALPAS
jgi:hypothetical protein